MTALMKLSQNFQYYGRDKTKTITDPDTGETKTVTDPVETGAILIENKTGKIISFVGGRDYKREKTQSCYNGSTIKRFNHETTARLRTSL